MFVENINISSNLIKQAEYKKVIFAKPVFKNKNLKMEIFWQKRKKVAKVELCLMRNNQHFLQKH